MASPRHVQKVLGKRERSDEHEEEEEVKPLIGLDSDTDGSESDSDSDSDSDAGDGEGTGIVEHHEDSEELPKFVVYDQEFAQIGHALVDISSSAVRLVQEGTCDNKRARGIQKNAEKLVRIPTAKKEKIAMLGSTGAGKSSLLNSLLGMPGMAKAMSASESCTYVATEYESSFPGQTKPFAAKVEYFDIEVIREMLDRLLKDYNTFHFELPKDCDLEEKQELSRLAKTAFTTFRTLFCDQTEFLSPHAAEQYLERSYRKEDEDEDEEQEEDEDSMDALEQMVEWCEALLEEKEAGEDDHIEYLDADTQDELLEQLDPLVFSTSRYEESALWPLVRKVRIGLESTRVLDHITLLDLPGLDDVHKVRVDTSHQIMRDCDTIWIVTKIDRAITETMVDSLVMRYGGSYKIVIICTGTDANIDKSLADHLAAEGQSIGDHDALLVREKKLSSLVKKRLPKKIRSTQAKLDGQSATPKKKKKAKRPLTENAKEKLRGEIAQLEQESLVREQELAEVAQQRWELIVDARNANATRRLKEEKTEHLPPGTTLEVFCVSNLHYLALKGRRTITGPRLDAKGTGVPALRAHILRCAAPGHLSAMENFISHRFTTFMKGVAMWARSYSVKGAEKLLEAIKKPQGKAQDIVDEYVDRTITASKTLVIDPLITAEEKLIESAFDVLEEKRKLHWSSTRAFIRRDGNHRTSVVPKQCWNEQFLDGANKLTRENWQNFLQEWAKSGEEVTDQLSALVKTIVALIENNPASTVLPMDRLKEIFEAQFAGIEQAYDEHHEELGKELRNMKLDLMQDRHGAYFTEAMSNVYEKCKNDSGSGVKNRTFDAFQDKLDPKRQEGDSKSTKADSPFKIMCEKFSAAIAQNVKTKSKPLERKTEDILREIYRQFDDMVDEKVDDKHEDTLRRDFREFLDEMEPNFENIKERLMALKARYPAEQQVVKK